MKPAKFLLSTLSAAALALSFSACSGSFNISPTTGNNGNTTVTVTNTTPANKAASTTPAATATPAPIANKTVAAKNTPTADSQTITGELQKGSSESLILYVGAETGDYAAYCFDNNSDDGRQILEACGDKAQCEVTAEVTDGSCKVPGLEADLSSSGRLAKVSSAKSLGKKR